MDCEASADEDSYYFSFRRKPPDPTNDGHTQHLHHRTRGRECNLVLRLCVGGGVYSSCVCCVITL